MRVAFCVYVQGLIPDLAFFSFRVSNYRLKKIPPLFWRECINVKPLLRHTERWDWQDEALP